MSSVNSVNIYSIDEERLKFRVCIGINARRLALAPVVGYGRGSYDIDIPIPTSFTNSHEYSSCRIKCDTMAAWSDGALATCSWGNSVRGKKIPALELQLTTPSTQATGSYVVDNATSSNNQIETQGFKQIITGQVVNQGSGLVWTPAAPVGQGWVSLPQSCEPMICANPFGSKVTLRIVDPTENAAERQIYIVDSAGAFPAQDQGYYVFQFEVQMVPNK